MNLAVSESLWKANATVADKSIGSSRTDGQYCPILCTELNCTAIPPTATVVKKSQAWRT